MQAIIDFIATTFARTGKPRAVIALSGGIDSATSLLLTARAIGPDKIYAFYLPAKQSQPEHQNDARLVAMAAGLPEDHFQIIPISAMIQKSWRIINHYGNFQVPSSKFHTTTNNSMVNRVRLGNMAARIRMMVVFDQAKALDALVIGTENYSEHLLGYYTRFGDEASDIEPIRHLYKTEVITVAKELGVPESILVKSPTADLWKNQTDANELGFTYEQADPILRLIDAGTLPDEIVAAGFDSLLVNAVYATVMQSAFKQQVPYRL